MFLLLLCSCVWADYRSIEEVSIGKGPDRQNHDCVLVLCEFVEHDITYMMIIKVYLPRQQAINYWLGMLPIELLNKFGVTYIKGIIIIINIY